MAEFREVAMFAKLKKAGPLFNSPNTLGTKVLEREPWMELFNKDVNELGHLNIFGPGGNVKAEPRDGVLLAFEDRGSSLESVGSPHRLLECILHAMIGIDYLSCSFWNRTDSGLCSGHGEMLGQGWLHRDVSVGNVLALDTPVERPPPQWYVHPIHSCCSSAHEIKGRRYLHKPQAAWGWLSMEIKFILGMLEIQQAVDCAPCVR
jgi:hypothetical protein